MLTSCASKQFSGTFYITCVLSHHKDIVRVPGLMSSVLPKARACFTFQMGAGRREKGIRLFSVLYPLVIP